MLLAKTRDNESQSFKTLLNKLIAFRSKEYNTILFFSHSLFKSFKSETELRAHLEKSLKDFKVKTNTRNNLDLIEKALKSSTEEAVALHDKLAYELLPDLNTSDIRKFCDKDCIETIRKYLMNINFSSEFNNLKNYYLRSDIEKIELANCSQDFLEKASYSLSLRRNFYKQIPYVEDEILDYLKEAGFSHSALNKIWSHMQSVVYKIKSEQYGEADQTSLIKDLVEYEFKKIKYNEFNNLNEQGLLDKIIHDIESNGSIYNYRTICSAPRKIDKGDYVNSKNLSGDGTYQLYISNLTALFSKESKQVFLHEFGHVLSNIFNEKDIPLTELNKYRSFRKCVSHDYTAPKKIGEGNYKHHLGDLFLTEEDSADVFSYLMTKNQNHLVECSLLDPNRLYTDYAEDAFIFQGAPNDTHSATFVRILREAHYKKRPLGTACQQVLKKYQSQLRFNTCSL